jgi:hypothetical protein
MAVEPDAATAAPSGTQYRFDGGLFRAGSWFKAGALIAFRPVLMESGTVDRWGAADEQIRVNYSRLRMWMMESSRSTTGTGEAGSCHGTGSALVARPCG